MAAMIQRLRATEQLLSTGRSAAFEEDRFRRYFHALLEDFESEARAPLPARNGD